LARAPVTGAVARKLRSRYTLSMRTISIAFIALLGCGDSSSDPDVDTDARAGGGLTDGDGGENDPCVRHAECGPDLVCAPAGFCFRGTIGDMECKANGDCDAGQVCNERGTNCVVGECGHDLDCATTRCDLNGLRSPAPYSCVECEGDSQCESGDCGSEGVCV